METTDKKSDTKDVFTPEQIAFIEANPKSNIILKATAGSGKTFCCKERIKFLLAEGVPPEKICFFSYTTAAVSVFKERIKNDAVKVTTIHAFCLGMLAKMQKFKKIVDIYEFIKWYKEKNKPASSSTTSVKEEYYETIEKMYDDAQYIGSNITAFKLQTEEGIKVRVPNYFFEYKKFQKETKSRDFSDMLIEVNELLKDNKWLKMFKNQFDYIFCDEAQDQSVLMMKILLALNAKYYTLILDTNQSIYGYSGANASAIIDMLTSRRKCVEMTLSTNFRSSKLIVEHANAYSDLKAVPFSVNDGNVNKNIMIFEDLIKIFHTHKDEEVAILVRTNAVIKELEKKFLLRKIPLRYFNYLSLQEIEDLKNGKERFSTKKKIKVLLPVFKNTYNLIEFIEENNKSQHHISTIHKSKGAEFTIVVLVNCVSKEILEFNGLNNIDAKILESISFDNDNPEHAEDKNVFYVGCTRPKKELYFCLYNV